MYICTCVMCIWVTIIVSWSSQATQVTVLWIWWHMLSKTGAVLQIYFFTFFFTRFACSRYKIWLTAHHAWLLFGLYFWVIYVWYNAFYKYILFSRKLKSMTFSSCPCLSLCVISSLCLCHCYVLRHWVFQLMFLNGFNTLIKICPHQKSPSHAHTQKTTHQRKPTDEGSHE